MAKSALVTGASGLLGRQVLKAFHAAGWNVTGTGLSRANPPAVRKLDLNNHSEIEEILDEIKPEVVIHSAANRFPDKVSADPTGARALNIDASRALAAATSRRSILLIYISTDYVFPGPPGAAPYEADAPPDPPNLYGQTKLDGEYAVLVETERVPELGVVLRVPILYGHAETPGESAVNVLMDVVQTQSKLHAAAQASSAPKPVSMDDWSIRYPTNTEDVARVLLDVATLYLKRDGPAPGLPRVLQFSAEEAFTKFQICQLFAQEVLGIALDGVASNKEGNDPKAEVQRPFDTHLSTRALKEIGVDVDCMSFKDWWRRELRAYRK